MSQENVKLAPEIVRAWERGDFWSTEWADPGIEFMLPSGVDVAVNHGRGDATDMGRVAQVLRRVQARGPGAHRPLGGRLVLAEFGGRGKARGVPVEAMPGGCLFSIRNGRVVRFRTCASRGEAIQAAGQQE